MKVKTFSQTPKSEIAKLLDENDNDNLVLYDENNRPTEFEQVAIIPLAQTKKVYAILKPVTQIIGVAEDEALVFALEEIDDEDCLILESSAKIVDLVFEEYYQLLREAGIIVD